MSPTPSPIMGEFEALVTSKNPLSVLFSIARLRELLESLADELLANIERSYSEDTAQKFRDLMEGYQKAGFYRLMYAYYSGTGKLSEQKAYLDRYFEESYWRDVDFYFFVLNKHPQYRAQFRIIQEMITSEKLLDEYLALHDGAEREFFRCIIEELGLNAADFIEMPAFLDFFRALGAELGDMKKRSIPFPATWQRDGRRAVKDLYSSMVNDSNKVVFWKKYFLTTSIPKVLLETLGNEEIFDCFAYLRNGLLKTPKYNLALTDKNEYRLLVNCANQLMNAPIDEKLGFVEEVNSHMGKNRIKQESFQLILRKGLMYDNSMDLLDAVLGISFISRDAYYEIKRRARWELTIESTRFEHLENVKALAETLEDSFVLRLFRPFLLSRLSRIFNKTSNLYYFIKFLLTIHESKSYAEYKMLSRFFFSLEAFKKTGFKGVLLRFMEFGWVSILAVILFFFAPFGTFLAFLTFGLVRLAKNVFVKKMPEIALTANFQLATFILIFATVSLSFGLTFGLKDNMRIVYQNFRSAINASTLIASETVSIFAQDALKASAIESWDGKTNAKKEKFQKIDYLENVSYY